MADMRRRSPEPPPAPPHVQLTPTLSRYASQSLPANRGVIEAAFHLIRRIHTDFGISVLVTSHLLAPGSSDRIDS